MKTNTPRLWDGPAAALTVLLTYVAAARLSVTAWAPGLWTVELLAVLGCVLGLALGFSQFQRASLRWLTAGYTAVLLPSVLSSLITGESSALARWASLGGRLAAAFAAAFRNEPVTDSLFFVSLMALLFWSIGLAGGYRVTRYGSAVSLILLALLPLLVVQYYDSARSGRIGAVAFFFLLAILLVGRLNFLHNRRRWQETRVFLGEEPVSDLARGLFTSALLVVLLAWLAPTPAAVLPAAARAWIQINQSLEAPRQRLDDLLAALQGRAVIVPGALYEDALPLGLSAPQGDGEVFRVTLSEFPAARLYWRVRVYDTYENGQWTASAAETLPFAPENDALLLANNAALQTIELTFDWKSSPVSLLPLPPSPRWVSRAGSLQVVRLPDGAYDLQTWSVEPPLRSGDQVRARAAVLQPTVRELRLAPETYPDEVKERYLALPADLSGSLRRLAERLTRDQPTAYDKAQAVTAYLRAEMQYSLEVPSPPPGVDPVDWFLFTWKSGFCNYYASAQVLLLRAAGVPARLAVGYAPGEYLRGERAFLVRARDAHAWPEVYFPGIGWVEFEPTVSLAPIYRPAGDPMNAEEEEALLRGPESMERGRGGDFPFSSPVAEEAPAGQSVPKAAGENVAFRAGWLWVIIFVVLAWGAAVGIGRLERRYSFSQRIPRTLETIYLRAQRQPPRWLWRWIRWSEAAPVERAFHAINQALTWLGNPPPAHATPQERAVLLERLLPEAAEDIRLLTAAHERTLYAARAWPLAEARRAAWRIRVHAARAWLRRRFIYGEQA